MCLRVFFLMIRRPPRSTLDRSSAASDVYKRQGHISIRYGFRGPNFTVVSACASSTNAINDAFTYIRLGKADMFITGGSESTVNETCVGGFNALQALSQRNDDPKTASRPFDLDRDGFVMGEGAGCLILEELEHAKARGAKIYAEIVGGCLLYTSPSPRDRTRSRMPSSA